MARRPPPVPLAPRHRRDWARFGRYCSCGLRWPCPDRLVRVPVEEPEPPTARGGSAERVPRWAGPTLVIWFGTAALLTLGQAHRARQARG